MPMTLVSFGEIAGRSGRDNIDPEHEYVRTYRAVVDQFTGGGGAVLALIPGPLIGDVYAEFDDANNVIFTDTDARCVHREARSDNPDNPCVWVIECHYAGAKDPVNQPARVEWDDTPWQEAMIADLDGQPVVNSAGDPFENGVMVDRTRGTLVITQNVADEDWNPLTVEPYRDSINDLPFLATKYPPGFPIGTCKIRSIGATRERRAGNSTFYWVRRTKIDIRLIGWDVKVRDAGYHQLEDIDLPAPIGTVTRKVKILDAFGMAPSTPRPLDGHGKELAVGGTPVEAAFRGYESMDWTPLNLEY